jgi:hypothetical protein
MRAASSAFGSIFAESNHLEALLGWAGKLSGHDVYYSIGTPSAL